MQIDRIYFIIPSVVGKKIFDDYFKDYVLFFPEKIYKFMNK